MILPVPVLVSLDKRGVYELLLPGISRKLFRGTSLAELLDDVALHLMETIPQEAPEAMPRFALNPHIQLRRVKITARMAGAARQRPLWTGRLAAVLSRWREDDFFVVHVPRLGLRSFAVRRTAHLEEGLTQFVEDWAQRHGALGMDEHACRKFEHLEILEADVELPSVLPSRPLRRKARKRRKKKGDEQPPSEPRRRLVMPNTLRQVGSNLIYKALDGELPQAFGRDELVERLLLRLQRPGAALLLVGPSGVGKTAIVYEAVRRLAAEKLPIKERTDVWEVDGNRIIAGMSVVGAWERRAKQLVEELEARQDVLYVADLPTLVYTGRSAHSDTNVAQYLQPHIARGELRIVGDCTPERLEATREEAPGFFSRFHIIQVPELDERQTLMALVRAASQLEAREDLRLRPETLETILALTRRFMPYQCHPGKAIELLGRLVGDHGEVWHDEFGRREIGREALTDFFARSTGLPHFVLWERQAFPSAEILRHFQRRIVGQQPAAQAAMAIITTLQQGLNDPSKPLATMLFVGPTGVGKTETAKALAEFLFGSADRLVRFDMSEFRDSDSVARLFGSRLQPEGELTRRLQQQPFSVVLFDEIEKAWPRVFDTLLQVFGEGRLTNAAGRTADFCNAIVVMTSNLGVRRAQHAMGFGEAATEQQDSHFRGAAERFFRPEFFNRIDRIVPFRALDRACMGPLTERILLEILSRRGLQRSGLLVRVEPELAELLADQGYDPRYGARSLRRILERQLSVPLARHLVSQPIEGTSLADLYAFGDEVGMQLQQLEDAQIDPLPEQAIEDWAQLRRAYQQLLRRSEALTASADLRELAAQRSRMLARLNEGRLEAERWPRFELANTLLEQVSALRDAVDDFQHDYLEKYAFTDRAVRESSLSKLMRKAPAWNHPSRPPTLVDEARPMALDQDAVFPLARARLLVLRQRCAEAWYRARVVRQPQQEALLRVAPVTADHEALAWVRVLADALASCLEEWGQVKRLARFDDTWSDTGLDGERNAAAIHVRGYGVRWLIQAELGQHMQRYHLGPDLVCKLARVEEVGQDGKGPIARLTELDDGLTSFRAARRAGRKERDPLEPLPVVRHYDGRGCRDPLTGEMLRLLGGLQGLQRVWLRRLLALQAEEEA